MHKLLLTTAICAMTAGSAFGQSGESMSHLQLIDRLDRPQDGYCLDIPGTGQNLRLDVPVFAHNCKRGLTTDSAVVFTDQGQIRFPSVDRCLTVAGVNGTALPGTSTLLRGCSGSIPFVGDTSLQRFELSDAGQMVLAGTNLCLSVGAESDRTFSSADRWRALYVEDCDVITPERSRWAFVIPG